MVRMAEYCILCSRPGYVHTRGNPDDSDDSDEEESDFKALEQFIEGEHRCSVRQAEDFSFVLSA